LPPPLTDDERAAVDGGQAALDKLLGQLSDVPAPPAPGRAGVSVRSCLHGCPKSSALAPVAVD
jgi:hypothetical protein